MNETNTDTLRARTLDEYVGQVRMKELLNTEMQASINSCSPLPHIFIEGLPGSGKTTLAHIIASTVDDPIHEVMMPVNERTLQAVVASFGGILFLDEIHRAPKKAQESLLSFMEFGYMVTDSGQRITNGWLTVIAATTKPRLVDDAVLDRFAIKPAIEPYTIEEMKQIIQGMAAKIEDADLDITDQMALALGRASAGRPREARRLVLSARALCINAHGEMPTVEEILHQADVDVDGLSTKHVRYLEALKRLKGQSGLAKIANVLNMNSASVEDLEQLLFERDYIDHSDRGRQLTSKGYSRLSSGVAYTRKRNTT